MFSPGRGSTGLLRYERHWPASPTRNRTSLVRAITAVLALGTEQSRK